MSTRTSRPPRLHASRKRRLASFLLPVATVLPCLAGSLRAGDLFRRGDVNGDTRFDISDPVSALGYLFLGDEAPTCPDAADVNDDGKIDLSDAIHALSYLFAGGSPPPAPGPDQPGPDPTEDDLACAAETGCGATTSRALTPGGRVEVASGGPVALAGAAVAASAKTDVPASPVTIACAPDIVPAGHVALGPAVRFGPEGFASDRPFSITLPYRADLLPGGANRRHVRIVSSRAAGAGAEPSFTPVASLSLDDADPSTSRATFNAMELTTYQVVAPADAGSPRTRRLTYRGIAGVSMGGGAATAIGLRHADRFDLIGNLGGVPGADAIYTGAMLHELVGGGFCTAVDQAAGAGEPGELCPGRAKTAFDDPHGIGGDFEHLPYQAGEGVGLTLRRGLHLRLWRDLARALGNPWVYNTSHPYLPPGVPESWLATADRCDQPVVLTGFHDREHNPDGAFPVITFCDGGDSPAAGFGAFDPSLPQTTPVEVLLAVDLNANGRRDQGEPVIVDDCEPWQDTGADGVADADEPGYDAIANPDPHGDDYHPRRNPRGTEGNLRREEGEPFEDVGLDGVAGTMQQPAGYDFGEGDGEWTINPNLERWYADDAASSLAALGAAGRDRLSIWTDAGIRDFLDAHVAGDRLAGSMSVQGMPLAVFDGFAPLAHVANEAAFGAELVDWSEWPDNVYLRYGDPDATPSQVEATGDGRHVGSARQGFDRIATFFAWASARWPGGDRAVPQEAVGTFLRDQVLVSPASGRQTTYAVFLPPGYASEPGRRYPVIFFLHGYGQEPNGQEALVPILSSAMSDPARAEERRVQKLIVVFADGRCTDGCEVGTFYRDSPLAAAAQAETALLELMDEVDRRYRTKPAAELEVVR